MSDAPPPARRSLLRTTLLLLPTQIVFRAGEAILPLLLAMWFGRTSATDVYYFAWAVFTFAGSLVFSAYQDSALVPILAEVKLRRAAAHEARRELDEESDLPGVLGALITHTLVLGGGLALLIGAGAYVWFHARYAADDLVLAGRMVPVMCIYLVALSIKTFFVAILNADHRFFAHPVAASLGVLANIGLIAALRGQIGVLSVAIGSLAGELVGIAALSAIAFGPCEVRMRLTFSVPAPVRRFARLIAAEVAGGAVTRVNPVVDQLMAGLAGVVGGGTLLRYSGDVASLPTSLLQASLLPVLLSHLSDDWAKGDVTQIRTTVRRALAVVVGVLLAVAAILVAVRGPMLRLVFLHGEMDGAGVDRMARLLPYHLVGLAPFGALLVLARAHVAFRNSRIMLSMGVLNAGCNALFNVVLLKLIGLEGIALSTSCVYLAVAVVFWFRLRTRLAEGPSPIAGLDSGVASP